MTDVQDMSLAEWAATSDGHRVLCSAARDALSRESAFATAALGSLARLAPLMAASTAGVVARRINAAEMQTLTLFPRRAYKAVRMRADALRCISVDAAGRIDAALASIPEGSPHGVPGRPLPGEAQGAMILRMEAVARR
ncbi:MAG: hypothetical protein SOY67_04305 [Collinsella sp.]|nr:hypothetical protein [Collinsella sp.]